MDINQYEELKQKLKRFEELSKIKEDIEYKIKCLERDERPWVTVGTSDGNIYFDTDTYRLIRRSIEKPDYKEKLRVRSYENKLSDGTVFVELKKKYLSMGFMKGSYIMIK